ncbi:MAG: hypothetical protein B7Y99_04110 [Caulobacterales bacterium 32-69-10]|nr:MAG: hypothetical protein B7Y99_04110 [Caulobacterales bacterium 32-69-10]
MDILLRNSEAMLDLARSRAPADRERLLLSMADLCQDGKHLSNEAKATIQAIFMDLVVQAEREIRQRLSEKLASAPWAPHALINILALDEIEIARPVIAQNPVLADSDLVRLLVEATLEHQIEVARRPNIGAPVVSAILDQSQPQVLAALADNGTAEVSPLHMQRLVAASRRLVSLRGSLARHPKLTDELAQSLYGWVGETLRASICERFTIDPALLAKSVNDAVADAVSGGEHAPDPTAAQAQREREGMERRLIDKLEAAGQLRPGYLLRALREGRGSLFVSALATLGNYEVEGVRKSISGNRADLLALACAGVGIDRSVFPTMISLVQALNRGLPVSANGAAKVSEAFTKTPEAAARAFRAGAAAI